MSQLNLDEIADNDRVTIKIQVYFIGREIKRVLTYYRSQEYREWEERENLHEILGDAIYQGAAEGEIEQIEMGEFTGKIVKQLRLK
jgi:hypothetical protein